MSAPSIYTKDGVRISRFYKQDYDKWDQHGRNVCCDFFSQYKWRVENNDGKGTKRPNMCDTDLVVTTSSGHVYFTEVEVKVDGFEMKWLMDGVHFTFRKVKNVFETHQRDPNKVMFVTVNAPGDKLIIAPGRFLYAALQIWPEYSGFGRNKPSDCFKMPSHRCFPIRKYTRRSSEAEDFISISWDTIHYFEKSDIWARKQSPKVRVLC